ncbi:Ig-like domain-containing protein [Hymenobacter elongatus]|uniref:Ig-like domain repeat protein n=1 Tax=Hymenobacter elongatus TaxID=877208 RepID=A0A4Z0PIA8_9BACT|nr:Ig-like domain-containing protein [Hymenobacter elongatus]TGE14045.1 Ig-like domain repeat protein [Hymenobacter elongatus]
MQKGTENRSSFTLSNRSGACFLPLSAMMFIFLLLCTGLNQVQAQAPSVSYAGPLVITQGGTYSGNYRSTDSSVPAIRVQTTQPVIIENCIIASAGEMIDARYSGTSLIIRNNRGYGLTPSVDNKERGHFVATNQSKSLRIENNYMEQTTGISVHMWTGDGSASQTLTVRYNQAKNIDARYRNGGNTFGNFVGLDKVYNLKNMEIAWNEVVNEPNNSRVEDNIALYSSGGTADNPFRIHDNYVQGAYPFPATGSEFTGTGMIVDGDQASNQGFIEAYDNHFVSTCNSAMNIAGGHDVYYHRNRIVTSGLMPNGTRLNSTYTGIAVFNYYGQGASFGNFKVDNNTIGYVQWGRNSPYQDRQDEADYGFKILTNTQHLPNPITLQTEKDEYTRWLGKVSQNGLKIGVGGSSNPTPTNTPPTVSLSVPATGTVGAALTLTATAADADGSVSKVEFFNGATKLGEDTSAPYALNYTPTAAGTLNLTARATDNAGAATATAATSVTITAASTGGGTGDGTGTGTGTGTPANATFFRALNLGGGATTIDGRTWEASDNAANFQINGASFENQSIALNPATDAARASMIRSSVYDGAISATVSNVANGTYLVYLYVWEDNNAETFNISIEGQTAQSGYNSGSAGRWDRLGPFTANVADSNISIATTGGYANLSGVEIWKQGTAPANTPPTVSLAAPATGVAGTALSLTATAADANGSVSKVEFFNGATKLGEDTSAPYALSWTPTAAGTYSLTARATDNAGATATSAAASVNVTAATSTATRTFYRSVNLNGGAITLDGNAWQGSAAPNYTTNGTKFANQNVVLNPATDATRANMIRSSVYAPALSFKMTSVPNGSYEVFVYVWEDNNAETFSLSVNGQSAQSNINSGTAGSWKKLGPYAANVTAGTISITSTGGYINLSGVEVWRKNTGTALNVAPAAAKSTASVSTFPNPVVDELSLEVDVPQTETMRVAMLNQNGATVMNSSLTFAQGTSTERLAVQQLPAGQYYLKFLDGSLAGKTMAVLK